MSHWNIEKNMTVNTDKNTISVYVFSFIVIYIYMAFKHRICIIL